MRFAALLATAVRTHHANAGAVTAKQAIGVKSTAFATGTFLFGVLLDVPFRCRRTPCRFTDLGLV
jgi:hypothetical protein